MRRVSILAVLSLGCGARTELFTTVDASVDVEAVSTHVFAHDDFTLYDVELPAAHVTTIGATSQVLRDIALSSDGTLIGVSFDGISTVSTLSGFADLTVQDDDYQVSSADFAPDGSLYVAVGNALMIMDPSTGNRTLVTTYPQPYLAYPDGDIAFVGARLFATGNTDQGEDSLLELDLTTLTWTVIGSTGFSCVYGLAAAGSSLYGFTCEGRILQFNLQAGAATQLTQAVGITFWGAAGR